MRDNTERMPAAELEDSGEFGINATQNPTMGDMIAARFNRRDLFRGARAVTAFSATLGTKALAADEQRAKKAGSPSFDFKEIEAGVDQTHDVDEFLRHLGEDDALQRPALDCDRRRGLQWW